MERNGTQISRTSAEWGKEKENLTLIFTFKVHRQEAIQQDFSNQDNCLQFFYLWICTSGMSHQALALKWNNHHCKLLTHRLDTSMIAFPLDSASAAVQGSVRLRDSQQGACIPTPAPLLRAAPSCSSTPHTNHFTLSSSWNRWVIFFHIVYLNQITKGSKECQSLWKEENESRIFPFHQQQASRLCLNLTMQFTTG